MRKRDLRWLGSRVVFAVSGSESAELFEAVEAAFDAIAQLGQGAVMRALHFAADLGRDYWLSAHGLVSGRR